MTNELQIIEEAKAKDFKQAFLPDPTFETIEILRNTYEIKQGWNNPYLTGNQTMAFGYLVSLGHRACEECGLIHNKGISRYGRCYRCGGSLKPFDYSKVELTAVTPKGIQIYKQKEND